MSESALKSAIIILACLAVTAVLAVRAEHESSQELSNAAKAVSAQGQINHLGYAATQPTLLGSAAPRAAEALAQRAEEAEVRDASRRALLAAVSGARAFGKPPHLEHLHGFEQEREQALHRFGAPSDSARWAMLFFLFGWLGSVAVWIRVGFDEDGVLKRGWGRWMPLPIAICLIGWLDCAMIV